VRRREFITLLGGAAAWPLAAWAQRPDRMRRVGVLMHLAADDLEGQRGCCRLTGVSDRRFLRASHIEPWRLCETNHERLDGYNGLLLTPTFFDKGYISFHSDFALLR
jgi:hypothetical protein